MGMFCSWVHENFLLENLQRKAEDVEGGACRSQRRIQEVVNTCFFEKLMPQN